MGGKQKLAVAGVVSSIILLGGVYLGAQARETYLNEKVALQVSQPLERTTIEPAISKNIYPCLPSSASKIKFLGKTKADKSTFYYLAVYGMRRAESSEMLVQSDKTGCAVIQHPYAVFVEPSTQNEILPPLNKYVPFPVALELKLQNYQRAIIAAGGQEKYQQILVAEANNEIESSISYPEDVQALTKLGIKIPKSDTLINFSQPLQQLQFQAPAAEKNWHYLHNKFSQDVVVDFAKTYSALEYPVDIRRMRVKEVFDREHQQISLYLISKRTIEDITIDPNCGSSGCGISGYLLKNGTLKEVFAIMTLQDIKPSSSHYENNLPCLLVGGDTREPSTAEWCYNGEKYINVLH